MKAYKLKFHSSFHLDSGDAVDGPSETFIHSDTLFSAICSAAGKFYGSEVAEAFLKKSSVRVSSAFPYYNDELFFPKPLNYYPMIDDYNLIKEFKKIKFVSKDFLEELLKGNSIDKSFFDKDFILNGCWRTKKNKDDDLIFKTNENPHIVVDRVSNSTQIFYKTEVYFNKNGGLFFLADISKDLEAKFETVLRFLGDEGIGADRTAGKGLFEVEEIKGFSINNSQKSNYCYLLSLYSPEESEFQSIIPNESFYEFEVRKGWVSNSTLRRKSLRMFIEGSVLKFKNATEPKGIIHNVLSKEDYPEDLLTDIYRSGQAIFFSFAGGNNGSN